MSDYKKIAKLLRFCDSNGGCCDCRGRDDCYSANRDDLYIDAANAIEELLQKTQQLEDQLRDVTKVALTPQDPRDGLYRKFVVLKADTGEEIQDRFFVLRPERDPAAVAALLAYSDATKNIALSADILWWVRKLQREGKHEV